VDFLYPGCFDRAPNILAKLHTRDLIYDCPQHVRKYLLATAEYFKDHRIEERLIELSQGPRDDNRAKALDRDITRGMLAAEAKCKSTHRAPWSQALHEATTRLHILKRVLSQWRTGLDGSTAIAIKQSKLRSPLSIPTLLEDLKAALRNAQRSQREVIKKGKELRNVYYQDRIKALQLANPKKDPDVIEKAFHSAQASKEMFRKVPSARPATSSRISSIKVPEDPLKDPKDPQTIFKSIVDPIEIERHILNGIYFNGIRNTSARLAIHRWLCRPYRHSWALEAHALSLIDFCRAQSQSKQ
jgi:hypothetical protein